MSTWPELGEELSRKVLGVIETRVHECQVEKKFGEMTLKIVLNSLYDTISGLVPWEVTDLVATAIKELE